MRLGEFLARLEEKLPPGAAFPEDRIGLQAGDADTELSGVYLTLDLEVEDVPAARAAGANLVVVHHPVIREPLTHVRAGSRQNDVLRALLEARLAVYVAHTNFDNSPFGMVHELGRRLELSDLVPLAPPPRPAEFKLAVFVPASHRNAVLSAMSDAGAGRIGDYVMCSFGSPGTGTFLGLAGTSPTVGQSGRLEEVEEMRLEMVVPEDRLPLVIAAMLRAHPYEEVAYDVYRLAEVKSRAQYVWQGRLPQPLALSQLAERVRENICLTVPPRVVSPRGWDESRAVQTVAVCPGGGNSALGEIIASRPDVVMVGELGYAGQLEARHAGLPVIVAGHAETERFFVPAMRDLLLRALGSDCPPLALSQRYPL
ncbi:Nif3-like dinuclear metal center hexameric protein [bacterium]|nr:Nif3-like dinuclear metal center hexameric protein [bacterium]